MIWRLLGLLALWLLLGHDAHAQVLAPVEVYHWERYPDNDPDQVCLYLGRRFVGAWSWQERWFRPHDGRAFGKPVNQAPVEPPADPHPERRRPKVQLPPDGVQWDQIGLPDSPIYRLNGKPCSKQEAYAAIEKSLVDDSKLPWLVVIGSDEDRKKVLADLERDAALIPFRDKLRVQAYPPTHWVPQSYGFKTDGRPTIYLQAPDGTVLHRQDDYEGGAAALAEAIRKADPNYRPANDPDKRKPDLLPGLPAQLDEQTIIGGGAATLVGVAVGASILRRRKQS
jgi:hypothetical protein